MQPRIRLFFVITVFLGAFALASSLTVAQAQPGGKKGDKKGSGPAETADVFASKLMAFNKAKNGKLTKEELTDTRLHFLFERADANKDGVVTREELDVLFTREQAEAAKGGKDGGDKGKADKGKGPKDGFGGKGEMKFGKGGFTQPGVVLNPFFQEALNLTEAQKTQLADLQKEVDARLEKILTEAQRKELRDMMAPKGILGKGPAGKKGDPN